MKELRRPELLVPAGSIEPFIAAVENGADAVYIGGRLFNARMNAGNFDDDMLCHALDYAHARGVKVFVAMNTLIYDHEMEEALEYARFLYQSGVDALIIQDLGLGSRIHQMLPDFALHLSTQATTYDAEAALAAQELGYERVVLARELTLEEITEICQKTNIDIEMFVHGALCICYSGQCQMSRFFGGRSGNRGACAQPCRLPYKQTDYDREDQISGHLLSPRDICLIDYLGQLIEAGVYSFKIEGRMKSAEYVAVVTRIYRKYIDEYMAKGEYQVSTEDRVELMQIFNRGGFTPGYLNGDPEEELMSTEIAKNQGIRIGNLEDPREQSTLVDVKCWIEPDIGDGIEIRPVGKFENFIASNIMTYKKDLGHGIYRIGDFKTPVRKVSGVYRTSSKAQLEEAQRSFQNITIPENLENRNIGRRREITLHLACYNGILKLTAATVPEAEDIWESQKKRSVTVEAGPYEADLERPTPEERYLNALSKTGNTPFVVKDIQLKGDFDIRIKASEINALRRECLELLEKEIRFRRTLPEGTEPVTHQEDDFLPRVLKRLPLAAMCLEAEDRDWTIAKYIMKLDPNWNLSEVLTISNVTKGLEDEILMRHYSDIVSLAKVYPVMVGNMGWLRRLTQEGCIVFADYGLNALNHDTLDVLRSLGVNRVHQSLEAFEIDEIRNDEDGLPLMISEHDFREGPIWNEKRGIYAFVVHPEYSSQSQIVPVKLK